MAELQIDTLGKAFQGLTLACARCHDHKFDPITARDYHALYGILASSRVNMHVLDAPERLHALDADPARRPESAGKFEGELSRSLAQADGGVRGARSALWGTLVATAVVLALATFAWVFWPHPPPIPAAAARSIAVLPFANRTDGADGEDFADGVTDELIGILGKVPSLRVVGRAASTTPQ